MSQDQLVRRDGEGITSIRICVCDKCGFRRFPPVFLGCEHCGAGSDRLEESWVPARGRILASATVPLPEGEIRVASVQLETGPAVRVVVEGKAAIGEMVTGDATDDTNGPPVIFRVLS